MESDEKKIVFNYRIRAYRPPAVYKSLRVFWWWVIEIFWIFAPKSLKKWTFGSKKWWFIQILLKWWFNQEWHTIGADTVAILGFCFT